MTRTFSLVDNKFAEADFFLSKLGVVGFDFFAARCYVSAFTTASRSVTYAIQAVMKHMPGFADWYSVRQEELKADSTSKFFNNFRTINHHIGDNLLSAGSVCSENKIQYWFRPTNDIPEVPQEDAYTACLKYTIQLANLLYRCYVDFGPEINAHQYYTADNFAKLGKSIEDAEEEVFGIRGWTELPNVDEAYRWQAIRDSQAGCEIDDLLFKYLGKTAPRPDRLPELPIANDDGWYNTKNGGKVWIPPSARISDDPDECLSYFIKSIK